jgi:Phage tail lysozyme
MKILDVILEASDSNVVVIGDSIAVGINGGSSPYAEGGISTGEVLKRVNAFIATGKAKGATVILSSGASNSVPIELEGGIKKPGNGGLGPVAQQLKALKDAGANVVLVGTGSEKSIAFPGTSHTGGKKYVVDLTGVNQQLDAMASSAGVKFLGPLEQFDPNMHSGKGDGIHPYGGYKQLKQAGTAASPTPAPTPAPVNKGTADKIDVTPAPAKKKEWARNPDGSIKQWDDNGKYIPGSYLAARGYNIDPTLAKKTEPEGKPITPTTPGVDTPAQGTTKPTERAAVALKFFISKGWTPAQAAGIVGNLQAESGTNLDNTIWGDKHTSYGIAQWRADRITRYKKQFGKDLTKTSFEEQLNYVQWEFDHTESRAAGIIRTAKTAKEAAAYCDEFYERSKGIHRAKRIAYSNNLLNTLTA